MYTCHIHSIHRVKNLFFFFFQIWVTLVQNYKMGLVKVKIIDRALSGRADAERLSNRSRYVYERFHINFEKDKVMHKLKLLRLYPFQNLHKNRLDT